jgi:YD repeat-containing protein
VTSRKSLVDGGTYAYTWDAFDRMASAQKNGGTMVYYHYDALGRLLYRDGGEGDQTYYYWLGLNKIAEAWPATGAFAPDDESQAPEDAGWFAVMVKWITSRTASAGWSSTRPAGTNG